MEVICNIFPKMNPLVLVVLLLILDSQGNECCEIEPRTPEDAECSVTVVCSGTMEIEEGIILGERKECPPMEQHWNSRIGYWREYDIEITLHLNNIMEYAVAIPDPNYELFRTHVRSLNGGSNNWQFVPWLGLGSSYKYLTSLNLAANSIDTLDTSNIAKHMKELSLLDLSYNKIWFINRTNDHISTAYIMKDLEEYSVDDGVDLTETLISPLKTLILSHNHLETLGPKVFSGFPSLRKLDLSYNNLNSLTMDFDGLFKLNDLNLSNNNISSLGSSLTRFTNLAFLNVGFNKLSVITEENFRYVDTLRALNLTHNRIKSIESSVFGKMTMLQKIDLSDNLLVNDICSLFSLNLNLRVVDIRNNKISVLIKNTFINHNLSFIDIGGNQISGKIDMGIFEGFSSTQELDLSGQNFTELSTWAFKGPLSLTKLNLSSNLIHSIDALSFKGLTDLKTLDLSNNYIAAVDFDKSDLNSLGVLIFKSNNIKKLKKNDFTSLPLHTLDLSRNDLVVIENNTFGEVLFLFLAHNKISSVAFDAFQKTSGLEFLDLSHNNLNTFDVNTSTITNLSNLYLNDNKLVSIKDGYFINCKQLFFINISNNQIQDVEEKSFQSLEQLAFLGLANNSLSNLKRNTFSHLEKLFHLDISGNKLKDSLNILNIHIKVVNMRGNEISKISELSFPPHNSLFKVDISNNKISNITITCFEHLENLSNLDVSNNILSDIAPGSFIKLTNVILLNASHNHLTTLKFGTFNGLNVLEILDISHNRIVVLNENIFYPIKKLEFLILDHNKIHSINMTSLLSIVNISRISIGGNSLDCNWLTEFERLVENEVLVVSIEALTLTHNTQNVGGITCIHGEESAKIEDVNSNKQLSQYLNQLATNIKSSMDALSKNLETGHKIEQSMVDSVNNFNQNGIKSNDISQNISANISKYLSNISNKMDTSMNLALRDILEGQNNITLAAFKSVMETMQDIKTVRHIELTNETTKDDFDFRKNNVTDITPKLNSTIVDIYSKIEATKRELSEGIKELQGNRRETAKLDSTIASPRGVTLGGADRAGSSILTETCVVIILVLLSSFIIYNIYMSKIWRGRSTSQSTQHISNEIEM